MIQDPSLSDEDRTALQKFAAEVKRRYAAKGFDEDFNMNTICDTIGFDVNTLHKEGTLLYAFWVVILTVLKENLTLKDMKYPTFESFDTAYDKCFEGESLTEQEYLWHTANWMSILFKMVAARKNKGLAMQVVPKLIEGWSAKYVTGSGQTKATTSRVHIFEVEGETKANHRGKAKTSKKKKETANVDSSDELEPVKVKRQKPLHRRPRETISYQSLDSEPPSKRLRTPVNRSYSDYSKYPEDQHNRMDYLARQASALLRDESIVSVGLAELARVSSDPLGILNVADFQRGFSWTTGAAMVTNESEASEMVNSAVQSRPLGDESPLVTQKDVDEIFAGYDCIL